MTATSAMEPIPHAFLSIPLYIPLSRHPVTREKVSIHVLRPEDIKLIQTPCL